MKVLQANKFFHLRGGTERYIFRLSAWLKEQGYEVIPFAMQHQDNKETGFSEFFPSFVQTEHVGFGPQAFRTLRRMKYSGEAKRKMGELLGSERVDVAHIHNIYTQLSPSILEPLNNQKIPVVMTVHDHHLVSAQYNRWAEGCGEDIQSKGKFQAASSRFHKGSYAASYAQASVFQFHKRKGFYKKFVDTFMVPCEYMKRQLLAADYPSEKIVVSHFGIDPERIEPRYDNDGYMLFVGRLSEEKGIETVIRVAAALPDVIFKIAGVGPQEDALHSIAHKYPNVEFLGFQKGIPTVTISSGAITPTSSYHDIAVSCSTPCTEDLTTINNANAGRILILRPLNSSNDGTLKDTGGNLYLNGDFAMDNVRDTIILMGFNSSTWVELSRSDNA